MSQRHVRVMRVKNGYRRYQVAIRRHAIRPWPAMPTQRDVFQQRLALALANNAQRRGPTPNQRERV